MPIDLDQLLTAAPRAQALTPTAWVSSYWLFLEAGAAPPAAPFKPNVAMSESAAQRFDEMRRRRGDPPFPDGRVFNLLLSPLPPVPPEGLRFLGAPVMRRKADFAALSEAWTFQSATTLLLTVGLNQAQSSVSALAALERYWRLAPRAPHGPLSFSLHVSQFPIPVNQAQKSVSALPALAGYWTRRRLRTQVAREVVIATAFYVPNEMSSALISRPQPRRPWRPTTGTQLAPQVLIDTPPEPLPAGRIVALEPRYRVRPTPAFRPPTFHELLALPLPPGELLWQPPAELFIPRRNTPQLEHWDLLNRLAFVPPDLPTSRGVVGEPRRLRWSIRTRPELLEYLFPLLTPGSVSPPGPLDPALELLDCIVWDLETGSLSFEVEAGSIVWVIQDEDCED